MICTATGASPIINPSPLAQRIRLGSTCSFKQFISRRAGGFQKGGKRLLNERQNQLCTVSKQPTRESKVLNCTGFILTEIVPVYCPKNELDETVREVHTREIIKTTECSLCYRKGQHTRVRGTESSSALLFAGGFTRATQPWTQAGKNCIFTH